MTIFLSARVDKSICGTDKSLSRRQTLGTSPDTHSLDASLLCAPNSRQVVYAEPLSPSSLASPTGHCCHCCHPCRRRSPPAAAPATTPAFLLLPGASCLSLLPPPPFLLLFVDCCLPSSLPLPLPLWPLPPLPPLPALFCRPPSGGHQHDRCHCKRRCCDHCRSTSRHR
jgi:hypothetical protein